MIDVMNAYSFANGLADHDIRHCWCWLENEQKYKGVVAIPAPFAFCACKNAASQVK
jgi:hypothetical protein